MHPEQDFDLTRPLPPLYRDTVQDLGWDALFDVMADGDKFSRQVAERAVLCSLDDVETIRYRQAVLQDVLDQPDVVQHLYALTTETLEKRRKYHAFFGMTSRYPSFILHDAVELLDMMAERLRTLRDEVRAHRQDFRSEGLLAFSARLDAELSDDYLERMTKALQVLRFPKGLLLSARLGQGNKGTLYTPRMLADAPTHWLDRLLAKPPAGYTFQIADRDEAGAQALGELRDRGIHEIANSVAQSADHVLNFFIQLRTELAFYLGCRKLYTVLASREEMACFPDPAPSEDMALSFSGLYDLPLLLHQQGQIVGNRLDAAQKALIVVTGANQGGKSTFLRSLALAQIMMQCGMFVAAESFRASVASGFYTHFKRQEDVEMESGKLDEELARMSQIVEVVRPGSFLYLNESFASTNEREGSELARQIVLALVERGIRVVFVTHLYDFAETLYQEVNPHHLFLRAERLADGQRTFKIVPAVPLETSFGLDLYREIFHPESHADEDAAPE